MNRAVDKAPSIRARESQSCWNRTAYFRRDGDPPTPLAETGLIPTYLPISAIGGGPPFHPNCVHVLTPFVERLATEEERKVGVPDPEVLNRTPGELQRRYRQGSRD